MKLLIARHGKSRKKKNKKGFPQILGGSYDYDAELAEKGFEQAVQLGTLLKGKDIDAVFSSDLTRAIQTAETASKIFSPGIEITHDPLLNERYFGELSGEYCDEAVLREDVFPYLDQERIPRMIGIPNTFPGFRKYLEHVLYEVNPPNIPATNIITINSNLSDLGVEPAPSAMQRITEFEETLKKECPKGSTVAVFCHGDVIKCWLANIEDNPERYSKKTFEAAKAIPSKGLYRPVSNCSLFEVCLG